MTLLAASIMFTSCEKVSPTGVLIGNTSVDDRVKQSLTNYSSLEVAWDKELPDTVHEYSFLVGSDSHITLDPGRLEEMLDISINDGDLFVCHLGDLADTKPEYYRNTEVAIYRATEKWQDKYLEPVIESGEAIVDTLFYVDPRTGCWFRKEDFSIVPAFMPFYPVVGNHDITHNGWALFSRLFKTSFYEFTVMVDGKYDRFIFLDSANGTLGDFQIEQIEMVSSGVTRRASATPSSSLTPTSSAHHSTSLHRPFAERSCTIFWTSWPTGKRPSHSGGMFTRGTREILAMYTTSPCRQ